MTEGSQGWKMSVPGKLLRGDFCRKEEWREGDSSIQSSLSKVKWFGETYHLAELC
jgi:hypothetical protein